VGTAGNGFLGMAFGDRIASTDVGALGNGDAMLVADFDAATLDDGAHDASSGEVRPWPRTDREGEADDAPLREATAGETFQPLEPFESSNVRTRLLNVAESVMLLDDDDDDDGDDVAALEIDVGDELGRSNATLLGFGGTSGALPPAALPLLARKIWAEDAAFDPSLWVNGTALAPDVVVDVVTFPTLVLRKSSLLEPLLNGLSCPDALRAASLSLRPNSAIADTLFDQRWNLSLSLTHLFAIVPLILVVVVVVVVVWSIRCKFGSSELTNSSSNHYYYDLYLLRWLCDSATVVSYRRTAMIDRYNKHRSNYSFKIKQWYCVARGCDSRNNNRTTTMTTTKQQHEQTMKRRKRELYESNSRLVG
jgi:hypothetical protein